MPQDTRKPWAAAFRRYDGVWVIVSRHVSHSRARRACDSLCRAIPLVYDERGQAFTETAAGRHPCVIH